MSGIPPGCFYKGGKIFNSYQNLSEQIAFSLEGVYVCVGEFKERKQETGIQIPVLQLRLLGEQHWSKVLPAGRYNTEQQAHNTKREIIVFKKKLEINRKQSCVAITWKSSKFPTTEETV